MISNLKNNSLANYFIIVLFGVILWSFKFFFIDLEKATTLFHIELLDVNFFWEGGMYFVSGIISFILFIFLAIVLNSINTKLLIIEQAYQSPGFFLILFWGMNPKLHVITPELISCVFIFGGLYRILTVYKQLNVFDKVFDAGFLLALASIFYVNSAVLLFAFVIVLLLLRVFDFREILVLFLGFLTPFIVIVSLNYLFFDDSAQFLGYFFESLFSSVPLKYSNTFYIYASFFFLFLIIGLVGRMASNRFKKIISQKYININVLVAVLFLFYFISPYSGINSMSFMLIPLSLLTANVFLMIKKNSGLFVFFILASALYLQYSNF